MQTYLPLIKALLSEWYLFTLGNLLYATVLAIAVWLLTATLYSIRIAALKKTNIATEKTSFEKLNALQEQFQSSHDELTAATEELDKAQSVAQEETKRALALEQLIYQRNQQIAGIIQTLASNFDLGERPLLATEDVKADLLWQQLNKVVTQLTERLRIELQAKTELQKTYQAETVKLAEKEVLLKALQTTIDYHTHQLAKLEQALDEQKSLLQQQNNAQQVLSDTLEKYHADLTRPTKPEPKPEPEPKLEKIEPVDIAPPLPIQLEEDQHPVVNVINQPALDIQIDPLNEQPALVDQGEEIPVELVTTAEADTPLPNFEPQPIGDIAPSVSSDMEQQSTHPTKGSFGKIKNLFGKSKPPVKTEPQWIATKLEDIVQQPVIQEKAQKTPGKLKGLYSKFRSKK